MYSFSTRLQGDIADIEKKVTEALQGEGFGVLTEIDVQAVFKKKLEIDRLPYKILGACNPVLANQAISADADIGLLLPCNVLLRGEENGDVTVGFMDPAAVLNLVQSDEVTALAGEVRGRLERVRDSLGGKASN